MKTKNVFLLNDNLDLKDENFLVKKDTIAILTNVYNETDETTPTIIGLKFENINGNYGFKEAEFKKLITDNVLKPLSSPRYTINDCVSSSQFGKGKVISSSYDNGLVKDWLYKILSNDNVNYLEYEQNLTPCS